MIFDPNAIDAFGVRKDGGADLLIVPAGPPDGSPETQQELLDKHYLRKHGPGAYYGQGYSQHT